jgi:hypothetical protein
MKRICRRQSTKREPKQLDQRPKYDLQTKLFVICVKILLFHEKSRRDVYPNRLQAPVS